VAPQLKCDSPSGRTASIAQFLALRRNTALLLVALVLAGTGERRFLKKI